MTSQRGFFDPLSWRQFLETSGLDSIAIGKSVPSFTAADVQHFVTSNAAWGPKLQVSRDAGKVAAMSGAAGFLAGALWVASRGRTAPPLPFLPLLGSSIVGGGLAALGSFTLGATAYPLSQGLNMRDVFHANAHFRAQLQAKQAGGSS